MKNLKDIILEKLKVSANTDSVSFTFNELCDSILRFVNENVSSNKVFKSGVEHVVNIYRLDYFKDNPLIVTNETVLKSIYTLRGCKVGTMLFNTKYPDYILCYTIDRSLTLKNRSELDTSFKITSENFDKVFNVNDLEKLYEILNEEN